MDTQQKIEQRREDARKRQKQLQKRATSKISSKTRNGIIGALSTIVCLVVLFALIFPNTGLSRRVFTAVTIGDEKISSAEYSYYYRNAYSNYYQMLVSYLGSSNLPIDTSKSLKKQTMGDGTTYADYFSNSAIDTLTHLVVLSEEAEKAGFTLPAEYEAQYNEAVSNLESAASASGVSVNKYLSAYFGTGFNFDLYKKCCRRELLATAWEEYKEAEPTYTEEQMDTYYQEHKSDYDYVDFRMVSFSEVAATEDTEGITAEEAKATAEEFIAKVTDPESFSTLAVAKAEEDQGAEPGTVTDSSYVANVSYSNAQYVDTNLADWLFSSDRVDGEKAVVDAANGTTFYAVYLDKAASRQDHETVSVRHILTLVDDAEDEEAVAAASQKADDILLEFISNGMTEEVFASLANQYSQDTGSNTNGGLYTDIYPGDMVTEFNDWCFDPERQPGDYGIVETSYGFHDMYFVGIGLPKWEIDVDAAMREEDYEAYYESAAANYPVKTHWLGVRFRSEPI